VGNFGSLPGDFQGLLFVCFCLCTKPDNFDLDIYYDGKKETPLKEKSNQICKFYHELCIGSAQHHSILLQISPPFDNIESIPPRPISFNYTSYITYVGVA